MGPVVRRLLPPALVLGALAVAVELDLFDAMAPDRLASALWLLLAAVALLAWRLRSARAARAALALLLLDLWVLPAAAGVSTLPQQLAAIVVPLDLALVAWLREASLTSRRSGILFGLLACEAAMLSPWMHARLGVADGSLSVPAWLPASAAAVGVSLLVVRFSIRRTPLAAGWLGVAAAVTLAFAGPEHRGWLAGAALVLLVALVERAFGHAYEDGLTGLPGRRAFDQRLRELAGAFAVAMVDVDHFKRVNDRHGHDVGDQVLRWVAAHLRSEQTGTAYRYGGEEFAVILPGLTAKAARPHAEALCERIAAARFALRDAARPKGKPRTASTKARARTIKVTVSIGVAAQDARRRSPAEVIKAADRALYRAKRAGRNRVAVSWK